MMNRLIGLCMLWMATVAAGGEMGRPALPQSLSRIAFGSCSHQNKPQPIWQAILAGRPELFVYLGDNIYADTYDLEEMREKYQKQAAVPGFARLRAAVPILATWDDHDYGVNDAGAEYRLRDESQREFLRFFDEPADSPRWKRPGVYDACIIGPPGRRVQVILLDTRYFRSELIQDPAVRGTCYRPNPDPKATVLGEEQWKWLDAQLRQPAEVRLLISSIQVVADEHVWEKWGNMPLERQRLYRLITQTKANGLVVISGDRHRAEISRDSDPLLPYTLWDFTTSGLTEKSGQDKKSEINRYRLGENYINVNFGLLVIDWAKADPVLQFEIRDVEGKPVLSRDIPLSQLTAK